jgi:hypothetical protein
MRVHVVSDVHGNAEALARAGDGADALLVLGDLVDFVDYQHPERGILGRVLGPEVSAQFGRIRSTGGPGELRAFAQQVWSRVPDPAAVVADAASSTPSCSGRWTAGRRSTRSPATSTSSRCGRSTPGAR